MSTIGEEYYKSQYIRLATEYQRQVQKNATLYGSMEVLKMALEKIATISTGDPYNIACQALDTVTRLKEYENVTD